MTEAEEEVFNDIVHDVMDASKTVDTLAGHLSCAESCETMSDLRANLQAARMSTEDLLREIKAAQRKFPTLKASP